MQNYLNYLLGYFEIGLNLLFLTLISAFDIKTHKAPNYLTLPYILLGSILTVLGNFSRYINLIELALLILAIWLYSRIKRVEMLETFGGGDIKTLLGFSLANEFLAFNISLIVASMTGIFWAIASSKKGVPFVPFLLLGYAISLILTYTLLQKKAF
ncbi:MAG: prepilin peptidase [Brevinematia bacterium]